MPGLRGPGVRQPGFFLAKPVSVRETGNVQVAALANTVAALRLSLHVLAATIWVGGQIVVAGLLPTVRSLGADSAKRVARAFGRMQWPAYAVLLITGIWNVLAVRSGQPTAWDAVLVAKIGVVVLAGLAAYLHQRSRSTLGLALWGAVTAFASLGALVLGVLLAG
jgi:putative copper export protein